MWTCVGDSVWRSEWTEQIYIAREHFIISWGFFYITIFVIIGIILEKVQDF